MIEVLPEKQTVVEKPTIVEKEIKLTKQPYKVGNIEATKVRIKQNKTGDNGNFYIYDLYDIGGKLIALNRYVTVGSEKQPFDKLTQAEEDILNPPQL